ncbi:hypothetical protein ACQY1Q_15700 [Tenacibaculum sp. TC6]|uniref:hypothetical protein n=1 Tax=Tenacibaculum sp. TC6 TaxID=3423223 RepID=UPI003D3675DC
MTLEEHFTKIAEKEGATLHITNDSVRIGGGARCPDIHYQLYIIYKDRKIRVSNKIGVCEVGSVACRICDSKESLKFELTTRSHFRSLFLGKKNRCKLKAENHNIDSFFKNSLSWKELRKMVNETAFMPMFLGENTEEGFSLITEYHMEFPNKEQVVEPLITFYKEFIDVFG